MDFRNEAQTSGVSWSAVVGGAFVAVASFLILLALGAGFGLSVVSPWSNAGMNGTTLATAAIVWLMLTEVIANSLGGYITGRLRTKWALLHTDEVFFRDTANGLLSWAVALVMGTAFLASGAIFMTSQSPAVREPSAAATSFTDPNAYSVDALFRSADGSIQTRDADERAEAGRIFSNALRFGDTPVADQNYLGRLVAARTGLPRAEAERRVSDALTEARRIADTARKETARLLLWSFLALLAGALSACYFATVGGRLRDHVPAV